MPPRVLFHLGETQDARSADDSRAARDDVTPGRGATAPPTVGARVALDARRSHHLVRVLRLAPGEAVEAFDGRGRSFRARVETADPRCCVLQLCEALADDLESPLRITLAQCLSSADRMDWTIEKAVELGVAAIVPLTSARSQVRLDATRAKRKIEHWRSIVEAACAQSGRSWLPSVSPVESLAAFVSSAGQAPTVTSAGRSHSAGDPALRLLVLDPRASLRLSRAGIARASRIVLLAGPESGLASEEVAEARAAGFEPVATGPRILRTETAGLAAIAALQALAGDF